MVSEADFLVNLGQQADLTATEPASDVTFTDIGWLAEISGGLPVVVKGVLRPDDAEACLARGAAGVIVSNHGGRQLDGAVPTALALSAVTAAVTAGLVAVDGGVRSGEDALAALALGARLVFLGRPVLWALHVWRRRRRAGAAEGFTNDLAHAMALAGAPRLADLADVADPALPADAGPRTWPPLPGTQPPHTVES